jgi:hypothetical protein
VKAIITLAIGHVFQQKTRLGKMVTIAGWNSPLSTFPVEHCCRMASLWVSAMFIYKQSGTELPYDINHNTIWDIKRQPMGLQMESH